MTDVNNWTSDADPKRDWKAERAQSDKLTAEVNAHNREVLFAALTAVWYSQGGSELRWKWRRGSYRKCRSLR